MCEEKRLIVELDGSQHAGNHADIRRTNYLNEAGYHVLRFWNNDVNGNLEGVLLTILNALEQTP